MGGLGESDGSDVDDSECSSECSLEVAPPAEERRWTLLDEQMEEVREGLELLERGKAELAKGTEELNRNRNGRRSIKGCWQR